MLNTIKFDRLHKSRDQEQQIYPNPQWRMPNTIIVIENSS